MNNRSMLVMAGVALCAVGVQAQSTSQPGGTSTQTDQSSSGTQTGGTQTGTGTGTRDTGGTTGTQPGGTQTGGTQTGTGTMDTGGRTGTQGSTGTQESSGGQMSGTQGANEATSTASDHVRRCQARYRSYNAKTDMFYARPGVKRRCKL